MTQTKPGVRVGDYFYTSWGYDQTNIDMLVVIGISPSAKTAICRRAQTIQVEETQTQDGLLPGPPDGPEFRMRIEANRHRGNEINLRGSYPYIWNHWGSKRLDSFWPTNIGKVHFETNAMSGH